MPAQPTHLARLAETQFGCFSRQQAEFCGYTDRQISHRLSRGDWKRIHRDAFAITGSPPSFEQRIQAATLAFPNSVASHITAAWLHDQQVEPPHLVTLIRLGNTGGSAPGLDIRRTLWLPSRHLVIVHGIPATSRARTLFDLSTELTADRLRTLIDNELAKRRVTLTQLERMGREMMRSGRPGSALFGEILRERQPGYVPPESELERRFFALCTAQGVPEGVRQFPLPWRSGRRRVAGRTDIAWPNHRLLCELDGRRHHSLLDAFENDRRRDQMALAAGWRTIRFTWRQLTDDPEHVVAVLDAILRGWNDT